MNIRVYEIAFCHRSLKQQLPFQQSNERLEFLGDAILSAVVSHYFYFSFPLKEEGFLTKMRSRLVNREHLNSLAIHLGIPYLLQASSLGKSAYGNALEALIGAIYLDRGYRYAQKFILGKLINQQIDIINLTTVEHEYKSILVEWAQKNKKELKIDFDEQINPQDHRKMYLCKVYLEGFDVLTALDTSKKMAQKHATKEFYQKYLKDINESD